MTGRSNVRNYVDFGLLPPGEMTFGQLLAAGGYATGICGKWQLGREYPGGKGLTNRRGTHVPLIVSMPGVVPAGSVCDDLVAAVDFLPTICAAAGVPAPEGIDGQSFLPQLHGERGDPRSWIYSWYWPRSPATPFVPPSTPSPEPARPGSLCAGLTAGCRDTSRPPASASGREACRRSSARAPAPCSATPRGPSRSPCRATRGRGAPGSLAPAA
jgi:hypothetical protein